MATIILSAAGAAAGSAIGGSVLGLSSVVVGRAIGGTIGRAIDQRIMGSGSQAVETGRVDRLRLTGANEGAPIRRVLGRARVGGQVIWASRFLETYSESGSGGGKGSGGGAQPTVRSYEYSVSLAIALCEGEILRVGRVWADGVELALDGLNMRVYRGSDDQLPDPKIEAIEGMDRAPAYRGIAYVVIEDLQLAPFGNRVPQLSFEVMRAAKSRPKAETLQDIIQGVALIPGMGEYALATSPVHYSEGLGKNRSANVHAPGNRTDFEVSLEAMQEELPACRSTLLVASWFGNDLRCGQCQIKPKVEQKAYDGQEMPWRVSGLARSNADLVPRANDEEVYGGTVSDQSVVEGIQALNAKGMAVTFYPFLVMDQLDGNSLPDPWTGEAGQPHLPWRGRITTSLAPGIDGSPDGTSLAETEVASFFGQAAPGDFSIDSGTVLYSGPAEWSFRRFILHYAHLCVAAGGVDTFCIGSEMRSLTQVRGANDTFPAVAALKQLASDVRAILGSSAKITYAADWSEYFGYHPQDGSGDVYFHLDPLWASDEIDFVGVDNYMPVADWRDGDNHLDAEFRSIYSIDYLQSNIEGGEGFDWYYDSDAGAEAQERLPITDGRYGEDWIFRNKDFRNWWANEHHPRKSGIRQAQPTDWVPRSKPMVFVEYGCAAIDKGANQPNRFLDPKSSESGLPRCSNGRRDDFMQSQYLRAMTTYWADPANNPLSEQYNGPMIDMSRGHVWAWDTRPYPRFPANTELWSDGGNYARGHWLNGRASSQPLGAVVTELCKNVGVAEIEADALFGDLRGCVWDVNGSVRSDLQPLMLSFGFDAFERGGSIAFQTRGIARSKSIDQDRLVDTGNEPRRQDLRAPEAEMVGRVRLNYVEADGEYVARSAEAIFPDEPTVSVSDTDVPVLLTATDARQTAQKWLAEARAARDSVKFSLPVSALPIGPGDVVEFADDGNTKLYRIDRFDLGTSCAIEATRVGQAIYTDVPGVEEVSSLSKFTLPMPAEFQFLDLPLLTDETVPHAPHIACSSDPWHGAVAVYSSATESGFILNKLVSAPATIGVTETELHRAPPGLWDRGSSLRVKFSADGIASADTEAVLNGANTIAIGDGSAAGWEVFQFADAVLVGDRTFELSNRLRGQLGTDADMPDHWPVGSKVVVLDRKMVQVELDRSARGLARNYRVGPAGRSPGDPSYQQVQLAFDGLGQRPYRPCHLKASPNANGDLSIGWIRRTRVDGDSWMGLDVPIAETEESYLLRILDNDDKVIREVVIPTASFVYAGGMQSTDGYGPGWKIAVAQVSDTFGHGPFAEIVAQA